MTALAPVPGGTGTWFDLRGDERLGRCATEKCGGQPVYRLEAGGSGSNYCSDCREGLDALLSILPKGRAP